MNITIKKSNGENEKTRTIWFPIEEENLDKICSELGIGMTTEPNCHIENSMDRNFINILHDKNCNIDELNYLMKRLDGFSKKEIERFYATSFAENPKTMAELINLSFNMHCYSLVSDFNDLEKVGKDLYLTERQAVSTKELDELDGESYAMDVIKNNPNPIITPYGVLYKNSNVPEQVYNGKQFPPYIWKETIAAAQLTAKGENEYIYLPCSDVEVEKALMRLETPYLHDCEVAVDSHSFPDSILNIVSESTTPVIKVDALNNLAKHYSEMGSQDTRYFEKLMDHIKPRTIDEVFALAESMYEFELFDGIKDMESYGRYMICESGRFEYDPNLEEYIDFKRYGGEKIAQEDGAFSDKGYIIYHGYNQKLANLLFENLGIMIPEDKELKTLKLYMPLTVTTYDIENDYGDRETLNEPMELGNYEIVDYIDEILEAIGRDTLPEEKERGLMRYYDEHDSVNGKVAKYEFSVEMVDDELMGVAILTLNDDLTYKELGKIKENVIGQAADGWGESFEQREISTDMGDVYISFWNSSKSWFIKTAEEMGINQNQIMGGMKFE
ncbi:antirestriction protein ArdA [Sedimentibacter sp. MB31-C6]|uniref:antirestriction protein ArdA n=1 Tax=Sedimentibacter sp. MB31-C6 TaxID=3109366 RepID=UPI002DDDA116|nr:antirestriction protein ArdA [Sedimentibacter sp. MB36-C1]WSI03103.1 antirestriction protein ArdA [Sedimentibacter sp. MB36-C1]